MKEEINYYQVIEGTSYYTEEYVKYLQSQLKAKEEENEQLKNNWNKLKKYTYQVIETDNELYGTWLLDYMKELEILSKGENKEIEFDVLKALNEDLDDDVEMSNM